LRHGEVIAVYAGKLNAGKSKNVPLPEPVVQAARARGVAVRLSCAGEGPAKRLLQAALGPASTFPGQLTQHELARVYASADLFLFPSQIDVFGNAALEALACGLPVLAARGSGFASSMGDCAAVRLLPGDDPEP
jgi:phosphatidylinositol alpha 1,6-mannosyltransferase